MYYNNILHRTTSTCQPAVSTICIYSYVISLCTYYACCSPWDTQSWSQIHLILSKKRRRDRRKRKRNFVVTYRPYKIYDCDYKADTINKQCNAADPLETPGGLGSISRIIFQTNVERYA